MILEIKKEQSDMSGKDIYVIYKDYFPINVFYTLEKANERFNEIKDGFQKKTETETLRSEEI